MNNRVVDQKRRDEETKRQTDKRNKLACEERRLKDMQKASLLEVLTNIYCSRRVNFPLF
jgi:hypothetical protein